MKGIFVMSDETKLVPNNDHHANFPLETTDSFVIKGRTVLIERIFHQGHAELLNNIIIRLIKGDI